MSADVDLIEQAMMTGYLVIRDRQDEARQHYAENPDCSGGDMLRAALGNEPEEFAAIRRDLVDAVRREAAAKALTDAADDLDKRDLSSVSAVWALGWLRRCATEAAR